MQKILKPILISFLCLLVLLTVSPSMVFAKTTTAVTDTTTTTEAADENTKKVAGLTPDSWFYPFENLIESVEVSITFSEKGKAELLIGFANERLAEAQIMTEKNQTELVQKLITAYTKTIERANHQVQKKVEDQADQDTIPVDEDNTAWVNDVIEKIQIVQNDANNIVIKLSGILSKDQADEMEKALTAQVQNTLALKAYCAVKKGYVEAVHEYAQAKNELGLAKSTGDEAAITAAEAKVEAAQQYKEDMQDFRKEILKLKNEVKKENNEILKDIAQDFKQSDYFKANYSEKKQGSNPDGDDNNDDDDKSKGEKNQNQDSGKDNNKGNGRDR